MNKKYLHSLYASFLVLGLLLDSSKTYSQNTAYTQLYNSATFVKTIDLTKPVGEIAGTETVTGSGGVAYTIPIYTPPGTNGLQPSISIAYNSQGGPGIAGFG